MILRNQTAEILEAVEIDGWILQNVLEENQSEQICLIAVKQNGMILQYVKNQTKEICLEAVKEYGLAIKYVKNQTEEICLEAVKNYGLALEYVKPIFLDNKICLEAVKQKGLALRYVENQTLEICLKAIKQHICSLQYVKNQTAEICLTAVKQNGLALQYVKNQSDEICLEAVKEHGLALKYVKPEFQTPKICLEAIKQNIVNLKYIKDIDMIISAIKKITEDDYDNDYTTSLLVYIPEHLLYEVKLGLGLIKNNDTLTDIKEITCGICLENKTIIALGCGHLFCERCSVQLMICPICRSNIEQRLRIFI